jgi:LmbE family N-acetylglucosaminyl deacetylase
MSTEKTSHPNKPSKVPMHFENTTDATRGEPLAVRAQKRRAELAEALEMLPIEETRARSDIEIALGAVDELLTGDLAHLSSVTAAGLNRWLESSKHLAEMPPKKKPSKR